MVENVATARFFRNHRRIGELFRIKAELANNTLSETQKKILDRMNRTGKNAEITVQKAVEITKLTADGTRKALNGLANEGYLTIDKSRKKYVYRLSQYWPVDSMDGSI